MSDAIAGPHLSPERLGADLESDGERIHLARCARCRAARLGLERGPRAGRIGPYEIVRQLGSGGMGRVYAARHPTFGERAIKVLALSTPQSRDRFALEARNQQRVRHPNVLPLLDVLHLEDGTALVLPLVPGPTLAQLLARACPPADQATALFREIVLGTAAIHAARLVHRDLKPSNLLLDPGGAGGLAVRISDFGLATGPEDLGPSEPHGVVGTPAYMAPEQRAGRPVDARCDVWALGMVLFELVTGRAWSGTSPPGLPLPDPWSGLLRDLLAADPGDRPRDAAEVLARLPPTPALDPSAWDLEVPAGPATPTPPSRSTWAPDRLGLPLPAERDSFVGRQDDLAGLAERLERARLITVAGPGGCGKTRLVVRYAALWKDAWPGGIAFADLSETRDRDAVGQAVVRALDLAPSRLDPVDQVARVLAGRGRYLMVLDNFEQVAAHAEATVGRWLEAAPDAVFVVTSRQRLGLAGEEVLALDPLAQDEATALLRKRVAAQVEGWGVDDGPTVSLLVRLLDGLPLALELAAARAPQMSPRELLAGLDDRFRLLSGPAERPDRQRTLRATLDWSWALLSDGEKRALAQLSVFEGGATRQAAEGVLRLDGFPAADAVLALMDRGLVRRVDETRFELPHGVRPYAAEQLGPETADTERRHGEWFGARGEALWSPGGRAGGASPRKEPGLDLAGWWALADDLPNWIAACRRAVDRGDVELALTTARTAWRVLERRGPLALGSALLESALALAPDRPAPLARINAANAARMSGRPEVARAHLGRALDEALAAGDRFAEASAQHALGVLEFERGRTEASERALEAALAGYRALGRTREEGVALGNLGVLAFGQSRLDEALARYQAALAIHRAVDDRPNEGLVLGNLGNLRHQQGRIEEALTSYEEALDRHLAVGNRRAESGVLSNLGIAYAALGRVVEARSCYRAALGLAREVGARQTEVTLQINLGNLSESVGDPTETRACYQTGLQLARELGARAAEAMALSGLANLDRMEGDTGLARSRYEQALALQVAVGDRLSEMFSRINLGQLEALEGRLDEARAQYDLVATLLEQSDNPRVAGRLAACRGDLAARAGDPAEARRRFEEAAARLRGVHDRVGLARVLGMQAECELRLGEPAAARRFADEAVELMDRAGVDSAAWNRRQVEALIAQLAQRGA